MGYIIVGKAKISRGGKAINIFFTEGKGFSVSIPLNQLEGLIQLKDPDMLIDVRQYEKEYEKTEEV